jgi:hypothetical protein
LGEKGKREKGQEEMKGKAGGKKKIERFEDLLVWQKGMEIVKQVYLITKYGELGRDFALRDQLRRAPFRFPPTSPRGLSAPPARNILTS